MYPIAKVLTALATRATTAAPVLEIVAAMATQVPLEAQNRAVQVVTLGMDVEEDVAVGTEMLTLVGCCKIDTCPV